MSTPEQVLSLPAGGKVTLQHSCHTGAYPVFLCGVILFHSKGFSLDELCAACRRDQYNNGRLPIHSFYSNTLMCKQNITDSRFEA